MGLLHILTKICRLFGAVGGSKESGFRLCLNLTLVCWEPPSEPSASSKPVNLVKFGGAIDVSFELESTERYG